MNDNKRYYYINEWELWTVLNKISSSSFSAITVFFLSRIRPEIITHAEKPLGRCFSTAGVPQNPVMSLGKM